MRVISRERRGAFRFAAMARLIVRSFQTDELKKGWWTVEPDPDPQELGSRSMTKGAGGET
jgi:hypothetical protein